MANTNLTIDMITNEALRILHQNLNFIGSVHREYDDSFAKSGAKIGDTLRIRKPVRYTTATGTAFSAQDSTETSVSLAVQTQRHVDLGFTSEEMTMDIDNFADRYLKPAMAQLAADIENDAFAMYADVYNQVGTAGTTPQTYKVVAQASAQIRESGLVNDDQLCSILNPDAHVELADAVKALFNPNTEISGTYRRGQLVSDAGGFSKIYENTMIPVHTNGSQGGTPLVDDAAVADGSTIHIDGVTAGNTWTKGTVFTMAGVNAVHPETRVSTGKLQKFVVTADTTFTGGEADVPISPALTTSGAFQTVDALPADNAAVTLKSGSASTGYPQNLAFHKEAFAFASADLELPTGSVEFASRQVFDGISMRIVRQYDISTDKFLTRADVLYGYKTIRPELACRITG